MKQPNKLDFNFVMASSIHDMKNSLSLLLSSLDDINQELADSNLPISAKVGTLQYETERINNDLVRLLSLYKIENALMVADIDEHYLPDFLEEQQARYQPLFEGRNINCTIDCDKRLTGYFDHELLSGVMNNVLANAIRYADNLIRMTAHMENDWLTVSVEDNGKGFPENMLNSPDQFMESVNFDNSSTQLGLYFSYQIAQLHKNNGRHGYIALQNGGELSGGIFRIYLP